MSYRKSGEIRRALARGIKPTKRLSVPDWADKYRILTTAESVYPGPWRTDLVPYLREPMLELSLHRPATRVVLMYASQTSKTECGLNWIGQVIDCSPCPIMILRPTEASCEGFAAQRLQHLLGIPRLEKWIAAPKSRSATNKKLLKEYVGGVIVLAGANTPTRLAEWPIRCLFADEVDRYPRSAGREGDPLELARKRMTSFGDRAKELVTSTPTLKGGSRIEAEYEASSRGCWEMPCQSCGGYQELLWRDGEDKYMQWSGNPDGSDPGFAVWIECRHCNARMIERQKGAMLEAGRYEHEVPGRDIRGFRLNVLNAPPGWVSWQTLVNEYLRAMERAKIGDTEKLQTFINTRLAKTWEYLGEQIDAGSLEYRGEDWGEQIPSQIEAITMGVDVHDDHLEVETVGWGAGLESWSLAYDTILSDPLDQQTWNTLDDLIDRPWIRDDRRTLRCDFACVDSGYRTQAVYEYTRRRRRRRVFAVKGNSGAGRPIWDRKPRKGGRLTGGTAAGTFHLVGTDTAKDSAASYLRIKVPGMGYCHFPAGRTQSFPDYFTQLTAEKRVKMRDRRGREFWEWHVKEGQRDNHALDCRVYALAAVHGLMSMGRKIEGGVQKPAGQPSGKPQGAGPAKEKVLDIPSEKKDIIKPRPKQRKPRDSFWGNRKPGGWFDI